LKVIGGSASRKLSKNIAKELGCDYVEAEVKTFPDGEKYVRIPEKVENEVVVVVQTTYPNENLIEMLLLLDSARRWGAKRIIGVIPYFSYARQDKIFKEGEAVSAEILAKIFSMHMDFFATVDIHNPEILRWMNIPAENVYATEPLSEYLNRYNIDVVISPDKGSVERGRRVAEKLGAEWDYLEKKRIDGMNVEIKPRKLDVEGKRVAIVDDIISTGGTIVESSKQLKAQGAEFVVAGCVHGVFAANAIERMVPYVKDVFCSDTIEREQSKYSVAKPIALTIQRWL